MASLPDRVTLSAEYQIQIMCAFARVAEFSYPPPPDSNEVWVARVGTTVSHPCENQRAAALDGAMIESCRVRFQHLPSTPPRRYCVSVISLVNVDFSDAKAKRAWLAEHVEALAEVHTDVPAFRVRRSGRREGENVKSEAEVLARWYAITRI
jgi:hypothetical protein